MHWQVHGNTKEVGIQFQSERLTYPHSMANIDVHALTTWEQVEKYCYKYCCKCECKCECFDVPGAAIIGKQILCSDSIALIENVNYIFVVMLLFEAVFFSVIVCFLWLITFVC